MRGSSNEHFQLALTYSALVQVIEYSPKAPNLQIPKPKPFNLRIPNTATSTRAVSSLFQSGVRLCIYAGLQIIKTCLFAPVCSNFSGKCGLSITRTSLNQDTRTPPRCHLLPADGEVKDNLGDEKEDNADAIACCRERSP